MKFEKIIFLDIDGPMLPFRAHLLSENKEKRETFDPIAVAIVLSVVCRYEAKIVVSSSWADKGESYIYEIFEKNGISPEAVHSDWMTRRPFGPCSERRGDEIKGWLEDHPEVTHYVAIDDMEIEGINLVKVSVIDGLLYEHIEKIKKFLK